MTAEKYYRVLLENGVTKLINTADNRENLQIKLVLAFGLELKRDLATMDNLTEEYVKEVLVAQNTKWNQLADLFFNLHGLSVLKKDYFSSIWENEDITSLILNAKDKGE